jgi:hypothetical protein
MWDALAGAPLPSWSWMPRRRPQAACGRRATLLTRNRQLLPRRLSRCAALSETTGAGHAVSGGRREKERPAGREERDVTTEHPPAVWVKPRHMQAMAGWQTGLGQPSAPKWWGFLWLGRQEFRWVMVFGRTGNELKTATAGMCTAKTMHRGSRSSNCIKLVFVQPISLSSVCIGLV